MPRATRDARMRCPRLFCIAEVYIIESKPSTRLGPIFATPLPMPNLGDQLRRLRVRAGLRQLDLVQAGVAGSSTISEVEGNTRPTTTDVLERWAQFFGARLVIMGADDDDLAGLTADEREVVMAMRALGDGAPRLAAIAREFGALEPDVRSMLAEQVRQMAQMLGRRRS